MKYILQINTGNTEKQNYTADQIIERLKHIYQYLDISRVIFGWYPDREENRRICDFLHAHDTNPLQWIPVFAEIIDLKKEDSYVESSLFPVNVSNLSEGDNFEFVCQSSERNIRYIESVFEQMSEGVGFDGVFLDRIRYKSASLSKDGIYGCQCENCQKVYGDIRIEKDIYDKLIPCQIEEGIYRYEDENTDRLMAVKRDIINRQIKELSEYFKSRNMTVGLDTFALCIADFVGQDIVTLGQYADFIKPMFYLKTTAPAGLPYELAGLPEKTVEAMNRLWNSDLMEIEGSVKQCQYLMDRNVNITPGIDVNRIEGICNSSDDYVIRYLKELKKINCNETVLCWDSMKMSDALLEKIAEIERE